MEEIEKENNNKEFLEVAHIVNSIYFGIFPDEPKIKVRKVQQQVSVEPEVKPANGDLENDCWHCKEFEQHINQRQGYCHKHKFDASIKMAKKIKCNDFIHY